MQDSSSHTLVCAITMPCMFSLRAAHLLYRFEADAILNSDLAIPLRGAAIGNGWIDSFAQYPSYLDYAVKHGIVVENSDVSVCASRCDEMTQGGIVIGLQAWKGSYGPLHGPAQNLRRPLPSTR